MACIVTGASSGIGKATALELSKRGVDLILSGRNSERLSQVAEQCRAKCVCGDIANPAHARELFANAEGDLSAVFAAGIGIFGPTEDVADSVWEESISANLTGLYCCCKAAIQAMLPRGGGRIVNVLSIASKHAFPQSAAYVASKFGALGLTRSLAEEYRSRGIQFTAFIPGSTDTPLWRPGGWKPDAKDMLRAEDVGRAIADIVLSPGAGVFDEVVYMPPKGIL